MIRFLWSCLIILAVLIIVCIIRTITGPRNTDRILAVNMIGTIGNAVIAGLATIFNQNFLADVAILYALLSFTAVAILSKIARGVKREIKEEAEK